MPHQRRSRFLQCGGRVCALAVALASQLSFAQNSVLTYHNDNARSGQNLAETHLTLSNVNSNTFGKLFTLQVDGKVDAQPLYVPGLSVAGAAPQNVVFVATEHDSVYAFDADTGTKIWQVSALNSGESPSDDRNCGQVTPEIGITATPVIDLKAGPHGAIYLVAMSKDGAGQYRQRLHALDLTTGAEQFGGPIEIQATYPGTGSEGQNGTLVFDAKQHKERAALLLLNGIVYTSWSSHCDIGPYTGWTIGYDELTLTQTSVFNFEPNGSGGAIWSSGSGPAADANGNIFFQLSNGSFETNLDGRGFPSASDFGNAFVRLTSTNGNLQAADYWTMHDTLDESSRDEDLGSGGLLLLPDVTDGNGQVRHLGVGAGKDQNIYLFDRDNLGKFNPQDNSTLYQELPGALSGGEFGAPGWFNGTVYFGAVGDSIRAFKLDAGRLQSTPTSQSSAKYIYPGTNPVISANGSQNAILWAVENTNPAVLHAYDANNLATELYNSNQAGGGRDQPGPGNKFITPTIADGKVFVGTTNSVAIFGLLNSGPGDVFVPRATFTATPAPVPPGSTFGISTLTWNAPTTSKVEIHVGAPDGTLFATGPSSGQATTEAWVIDGMVFYLQDATATNPVAAANTLAIVTAKTVTASPSFTISADPIYAPYGTLGAATLTWNSPLTTAVQIHVGSPDGPLLTNGKTQGSATTGNWITDGMTFYLQDISDGHPLSSTYTLATVTAHVALAPEVGALLSSSNPVLTSSGQMFASTTMNWISTTASLVEVHVGAPDGPLFARGPAQGSASTYDWVTNGMTFYLQDVSKGQPLTSQFTVATQTIEFTDTQPAASFQASPNPILAAPGTNFGTTTLYWNTPSAARVEIHVNAPDGPLFASGRTQGQATTFAWVSDGLMFYLQDVSNGKPLDAAGTLATVKAHLLATSTQ
jgi:hypothetical protein